MTLKKRRIILMVCVLLFLALVPPLLLYTSGSRWSPSLGFYKTGGLNITSPFSGSQIFVNNVLERETNILQNGLFLQNLKPGRYTVLVAKENYWPWIKEMEVREEYVTEAMALLVPQDPEGKILREEDYTPGEVNKYAEILSSLEEIRDIRSATSSNLVTGEGRVEVLAGEVKEKLWWSLDENKLWAEWTGDAAIRPYYLKEDKVLVLNSQFPIKNAEFFPGRRDVAIVATNNGIYAIEIDGSKERTLPAIYKGKDPVFTTYKNEQAVYILDEEVFIKIKL